MATTTRRRTNRAAPAAKRPAPKKQARRRPPAARRPARRGPGLLTRVRQGLATVLGRQSDDVWGVVFLVAAAVAALGIYLNLTGPAGHAIKTVTGDLFGWGRVLVPPILGLVGVSLIRGRIRREPARAALGSGLLLIAISGILHLARGPASWKAGFGGLSHLNGAGGLIGAAVGAPLRSLLAPWGAGIVLATAVALSLLILTATPVRQAADHLGRPAGWPVGGGGPCCAGWPDDRQPPNAGPPPSAIPSPPPL